MKGQSISTPIVGVAGKKSLAATRAKILRFADRHQPTAADQFPFTQASVAAWLATVGTGRFAFHGLRRRSPLHQLGRQRIANLDRLRLDRVEPTQRVAIIHLAQFLAQLGRKCLDPLPNLLTRCHPWLLPSPSFTPTPPPARKIDHTTYSRPPRPAKSRLHPCEEGHIERSPLPKINKPPRRRREIYYTAEQWQRILTHVPDPQFRDLLDFLWSTGCRPQEARLLEVKHVQLTEAICVLPASLAKGGVTARVIHLDATALAIVQRLMEQHPSGPLFRNTRGDPWTKDAIKCRLNRISQKVGFRCIACHSYATEGLTNGVDSLVLGHLMGHRDAS